jgi:hypothetical protein
MEVSFDRPEKSSPRQFMAWAADKRRVSASRAHHWHVHLDSNDCCKLIIALQLAGVNELM